MTSPGTTPNASTLIATASREAVDANANRSTQHWGRGYLPALDGVRGLAILLVMVFHFVDANRLQGTGPVSRALVGFAGYGGVGVDLFFVLSGFLITGILLNSRDEIGSGQRVSNYFATYYAVLIGLFVIGPHVPQLASESFSAARAHQGWYWFYLANWPLANGHPDWIPWPTLHLWSLAVEEQFYLIWPAVVLVTRTDRRLAVVCVLGFLAAICYRIGATGDAAYFATTSRMDALLLGALATLAIRHGRLSIERANWLAIGGSLVLLIILTTARFSLAKQLLRYSTHAVIGSGLISGAALAIPGGKLARFWEQPFLRWLGKYSYGLYVMHEFVLSRVNRILPFRAALAHSILSFAFYFAMTAFLATLSWVLLERPFLKLKRFFPSVEHSVLL
jgi:peptidoglycan/LPS O-acetylase OafA/YrhL